MKAVSNLWQCSTCAKSFGRKGDLTRHELLHKGIKPHKCQEPGCGKAFSQNSGLKTHMNIHSGVKPYICGFNRCEATFGDPSSCTRHRKETHRRIGGYQCFFSSCTSRIKRRSAFAAHLRRHSIDPSNLDIDKFAPPLLPSLPVMDSIPRSTGEVIPYNLDAVTERELFQSLRPNELGLYDDPYQRRSDCFTHYVPSAFSELVSSSTTFDVKAEDLPKWEEFNKPSPYSIDSSFCPDTPLNPANLIISSPSPKSYAHGRSKPFSRGPTNSCDLDSHGNMTFDRFHFPSDFDPAQARDSYGHLREDNYRAPFNIPTYV